MGIKNDYRGAISVTGNGNVVAANGGIAAHSIGIVNRSETSRDHSAARPAAEPISTVEDETVGKSALTRAGVWFLFRELRRKGVINQMSDTELSAAVGAMTGYSAEKLRQGGLLTDKARDALTDFLQGLIDETEGL